MKEKYYHPVNLKGVDADYKLEKLDRMLKKEGAKVIKIEESLFPLTTSLVYEFDDSNLYLKRKQEIGRFIPPLNAELSFQIEGSSQKLRKILESIFYEDYIPHKRIKDQVK